MKHIFLSSLLTAGFLAITTGFSSAQTRLRMEMNGIFNSYSMFKHPDINIGDTYAFFLEFNDTDLMGEGTPQFTIKSVLEGGLLVNGVPYPLHMPEYFYLQGDAKAQGSVPARSATLTVSDGNQVYNSVVMTSTSVSPSETSVVGENVEFSDIPLFDSMDTTGTKFVVNGSDPGPGAGMYQAYGSVSNFSITVVPEPGGAVLGGVAVLGMMLRRRR